MSYKTILVYADPTSGAKRRLEAAASVAMQFDATLIGVAAALLRPLTDPYGQPLISTTIGSELKDKEHRIQTELRAAESTFRTWAAAAGVACEWRDEPEFTVDLIVASPSADDDTSDFRPVDLGALLLRSGRPVLAIPAKAEWTGASRVVVAWKDTREARRALADALPLLQGAENVAIVEILEPQSRSDGSLAAAGAFLSRHGISVEPRSETQRETSVEEQLFRYVEADDTDLIVAGGYGHSRLGEWVFGGVTNALIRQSPVPVFLSH